MSQENVEILLKARQAFLRGDWSTMAATWDQHIFVRNDPFGPEWGCCGCEAAGAFLKEAAEAWAAEVDVEQIVDLGDRLLVRSRYGIHARRSGVEGEQRISEIVTYRGCLAILIEFFLDHEQA